MEPTHDHQVTLAFEDQCLKLTNIQNASVQVILYCDFVDKSTPDFQGVKDQLILTLSPAIFLQNPLVFIVQLVDVDIGKVMVQPLGPGIRKIRGLLEQCSDVLLEVIKRLPVLRVYLSVVEETKVGSP